MKNNPAISSHVYGAHYPSDFHKPVAQDCADCGKLVDMIDLFPGGRCLECHAADPAVDAAIRGLSADGLARMWGAK
jgi:hypothetical protein